MTKKACTASKPPQSYLTDTEWKSLCAYYGEDGTGECSASDLKPDSQLMKQLQELEDKYQYCAKKGVCYMCGHAGGFASKNLCPACYMFLRRGRLRTAEKMKLRSDKVEGAVSSLRAEECVCCNRRSIYARNMCRNCYAAYRRKRFAMTLDEYILQRRVVMQWYGRSARVDSGTVSLQTPSSKLQPKTESLVEICNKKISADDKELFRVLLDRMSNQKSRTSTVEIYKADYAKAKKIKEDDGVILKSLGKLLSENVAWLPTEGNASLLSFRWLESAQIRGDTIVLALNPLLCSKAFAQAAVCADRPLEIKSKYSARMYAYCMEHRKDYELRTQNAQPYVVDLKQLTTELDCPLTTWTDIKRYVLEKAKDDLNGKSNVNIDYSIFQKERKRVVKIALRMDFVENRSAQVDVNISNDAEDKK